MVKQYPVPTKNDSHKLAWERRFTLFSHALQDMFRVQQHEDEDVPKHRADLEKSLGMFIVTRPPNRKSVAERLRLEGQLLKNEAQRLRSEGHKDEAHRLFHSRRQRYQSDFERFNERVENDAGMRQLQEWKDESRRDCLAVSFGLGFCCSAVFFATGRALRVLARVKNSRFSAINRALAIGVGMAVAGDFYSVFDDTFLHQKAREDLPLLEGKSLLRDDICGYFTENFRALVNRKDPQIRQALSNPSTPHLKLAKTYTTNCLRRFHLQEQLRRERGIAPDSPLLPVSIPPPGVPKTGRMVDGELVMPEEVFDS